MESGDFSANFSGRVWASSPTEKRVKTVSARDTRPYGRAIGYAQAQTRRSGANEVVSLSPLRQRLRERLLIGGKRTAALTAQRLVACVHTILIQQESTAQQNDRLQTEKYPG